jgi:hypothetical protein
MTYFNVKKTELKKERFYITLLIASEITKTSQIERFPCYILKKLPNLKNHICKNGSDKKFIDELKDTELAHACEHILIELIDQKDPQTNKVRGYTDWNWKTRPKWTYQIVIEYNNENIIRPAIHDMLQIIEEILPNKNSIIVDNLSFNSNSNPTLNLL